MHCCYLIRNGPKTYIGYSNDPFARLKVHNSLKGAKATTRAGPGWSLDTVVASFDTWNEALRFEWALQHPTKSKWLRDIPTGRGIMHKRGLMRTLQRRWKSQYQLYTDSKDFSRYDGEAPFMKRRG